METSVVNNIILYCVLLLWNHIGSSTQLEYSTRSEGFKCVIVGYMMVRFSSRFSSSSRGWL